MAEEAVQRQFCTFRTGGLLFGVEAVSVQEILRRQETTHVPLAPPVVAGLINLRGQIVTALDLRRRLGIGDRESGASFFNVVVRTADGAVSLIVDEIGDVVNADESAFEPPPETLDALSRELILGAYKLDDELLLVLDVEAAVRVGVGA